MSVTLTPKSPKAERISRNLGILTGTIVINGSTDASGLVAPVTIATGGQIPAGKKLSEFFAELHCVQLQVEPAVGFATTIYEYRYDMANDKVVVYKEAAEVAADDTSGVTEVLASTALNVTISFVAFGKVN